MKAAQARKQAVSTQTADGRDTAFLHTGFEDSPVASVIAGSVDQPLIAINTSALRLFGLDRSGAEVFTLAQVFEGADLTKIQNASADLAHTGKASICLPALQMRREGHCVPVDLTIARHGESQTVIAVQNAKARLDLEQQLRQAAKMESVGMLAGGVAHDFNNLLTIISGYTQMLQTSPYLTTERDKIAVEQILKASERAAELTSQLLAFSRRRAIQPGVIEPAKVIDQTTLMLRRLIGEHIELRIHQEQGAGRIYGDVAQVQQVIMNLVINSRDAMPNSGLLMIETRNMDLDGPLARKVGLKPGPHVMIAISDTGSGMDNATQQRIFEPFFTTKGQGKGTGLGLATVSGIVRQYGGAIDLYSELGHGTTFKVFFPRVDSVTTEEKEQVQIPEAAGGTETVLLAEDEEGVRKMVTSLLERRGYRVLVAGSGREALNLSRSYPGRIDLLLTDLVMPQMNGRELAAALSLERHGLPVLFISGYAGETTAALSEEEVQSRFLQKPFAPALLSHKVRELLDKQVEAKHRAEHHTAKG